MASRDTRRRARLSQFAHLKYFAYIADLSTCPGRELAHTSRVSGVTPPWLTPSSIASWTGPTKPLSPEKGCAVGPSPSLLDGLWTHRVDGKRPARVRERLFRISEIRIYNMEPSLRARKSAARARWRLGCPIAYTESRRTLGYARPLFLKLHTASSVKNGEGVDKWRENLIRR